MDLIVVTVVIVLAFIFVAIRQSAKTIGSPPRVEVTVVSERGDYGASKAHRWLLCPGSVRLIRALPPEKPEFPAVEGTVAHLIAKLVLTNEQNIDFFRRGTVQAHGFAVPVKSEMLSAIRYYIRAVHKRMDGPNARLFVEQRVHMTSIHPAMIGTADAIVQRQDGRVCVLDFKYGRGNPPEGGVPQMSFYALGAAHMIGIENVQAVEVVIVQPRREGYKTVRWKMSREDLEEWSASFSKAIALAEKPDPPLRTGLQCKYCPALKTCPQIKARIKRGDAEFFEQLLEEAK